MSSKRQAEFIENVKEDSFEIFITKGFVEADKYFNHKMALLKAYNQRLITLKELNEEF